MIETVLTLVPVIASTLGTTIISKIAIGIIKHVSNKKNEEVEVLKEQNKLLTEQNLQLKNTLANIDNRNSANIKNQEIIIKEVGMSIDAQRKSNEETSKIIDSATTIRNELMTLLQAKKE